MTVLSQSPQAGQFNSYAKLFASKYGFRKSQSPQAGQFNSYMKLDGWIEFIDGEESQSPQAGQFNSYLALYTGLRISDLLSLNPLKRVNSILTLSRKT